MRVKMLSVLKLNRLTGKLERMSPIAEAAYHVALCVFDLDDPKASTGRKRRAAVALEQWRRALQERASHD